MNIVLNNPLETEAIAKIIGQKAQAGDVIVLTGDLGAGKTTIWMFTVLKRVRMN